MKVTMGREFARQMETTGGPIDIDEVQRKFQRRRGPKSSARCSVGPTAGRRLAQP
jgi:hypothetical protein